MRRQKLLVSGFLAASVGTVLGCSKHSGAPTSPSATAPAILSAATAGVDLKAPAPTIITPVNDVKVEQNPTLTAAAVNGTYISVPLSYDFELYDPNNTKVAGGIRPGPTFPVTIQLDFEKRYTWRVRAALVDAAGNHYGPWSAVGSFISPTGGYIRGAEVYDPLTNGKTVGQIHGPVTFIPNVGVRLESEDSWITYHLQPGQLTSGNFSALYRGLTVVSSIENPKNAIMAMSQDTGAAFNDNPFRMSVEVRGNGAVAFRFIAGGKPYAETVGAERQRKAFHEDLTYFAETSWQPGFFKLTFREGGFNGRTIYDYGKPYSGLYSPNPHSAFVGRPWTPGTRDNPASYQGAIVRQVWLSNRPRPSSINQ